MHQDENPRARLGTACLVGWIALTGLAALPLRAEPEPSTPVSIVTSGKSDWQLVSPSLKTLGVSWAVDEWRKYVRQMSGCELPAGEDDAAGAAIVIGLRSELSAADQQALPSPTKGYDGYAIVVRAATDNQPARIIVGGDNDRGAIYGVYYLLERLGCRWFYPTQNPNDPEVVPHRETLALPAGSWSKASPMRHRICNGSSWFLI